MPSGHLGTTGTVVTVKETDILDSSCSEDDEVVLGCGEETESREIDCKFTFLLQYIFSKLPFTIKT